MKRAMTILMEGEVESADIYSFLIALHEKGETVEEITAAAQILRDKAIKIKAPHGSVDCCGTGGDAKGTYNISTAVALVAAAAGVPIAKHGNRASTSKSGAADVLEVMGVNLDAPMPVIQHALSTLGFTFMMATQHHPAMAHVKEVRKQIPHRTIFNILGPLTNPAGTKRQLLGVYSKDLLLPFAQVLKNLGSKKAWIVHGSDGMDEITLTGPTYVARLDEEGNITEQTLTPEDFGLPTASMDELQGGTAEENAVALRALLEGRKDDYRNVVLANTAAVLVLNGKASDLKDGVKKAATAIDKGFANDLLKDYIMLSRTPAEDIAAE
jgi:anthranilate phosphoribosyltransferase